MASKNIWLDEERGRLRPARKRRKHRRVRHQPAEPSFAQRLRDAEIDAAMGLPVDDELVDHLPDDAFTPERTP